MTQTAIEIAREKLDRIPAQSRVEVVRGMQLRRKKSGQEVMTLHYSAIPERDPLTPEGQAWYKRERKTYDTESGWRREQEIDAYARGGEVVFGYVLSQHYEIVVINDPYWMPKPEWDVIFGFDHGKRNATALLKGYVERQQFDPISGKKLLPTIWLAGEYYSMQREGWQNNVSQNVAEMKKMPDLDRARWVKADPSIFYDNAIARDDDYEAINAVYVRNNFKVLSPYDGVRSDVTFTEWMLSDFWGGLDDGRKPRLYIVCRNPSDRPQPGLHPYDCPNLLWELRRARRVEMTARQLLSKNPSDALQDKDNHIRDAMKYLTGTVKAGAATPIDEEIQKKLEGLDATTASIRASILVREKIGKGFLGIDGNWRKKAAPVIPLGRGPVRRRGW